MSTAPKPPRKTTAGVARPGPPTKRPWLPPRIRTGHLFESNSLACGKNAPYIDQCVQNPVMS
jgi:hypothetical protein